MTRDAHHDPAIGELQALVRSLQGQVERLRAELQASHDELRHLLLGAGSDRPAAEHRWQEVLVDDLPDRIRRGDHWDLLWRDDPEDRFHDEDDPDDDDRGGGTKVPAWPVEPSPMSSGGVALPLPVEDDDLVIDRPAAPPTIRSAPTQH